MRLLEFPKNVAIADGSRPFLAPKGENATIFAGFQLWNQN
jgi:hypothetical protein